MTNEKLREYLIGRIACEPAMDWLGDRDLETTWRECERADWLLWLVGPHIPRTDLVWLACQCARTALVCVPEGEERPRICVETTERWSRGEASMEEVKAASSWAKAAAEAAWAAEAAEAHIAMCAIIRAKYPVCPNLRKGGA